MAEVHMSEVAIKNEDDAGFEDDVSLSSESSPIDKMDDDDDDNDHDHDNADDDDDDDDKYEDSLDLDTAQQGNKVWLVRLPKFLMDKWKKVDEISGEELGKVRICNQPRGADPWKVQLILNDTPEVADIPHEYDISLVNKSLENTYVFTEEDWKSKTTKRTQMHKMADDAEEVLKEDAAIKIKPGSGASKNWRSSARSNNRYKYGSKKFQPYVRTISKKTALVGTACHECLVMPSLKDPNYSNVVRQRKVIEQELDKSKVTFLDELPGVSAASFGPGFKNSSSAFIRSQKKDIYKNGEGKATRIPRNELLDLLFKLFEEYDYWSLKGLRERTKQPETYLKEVLDTMALLIKKGPYAMKYTLKPEFKQIKGMGSSLSAYMEQNGDGSLQENGNVNEGGSGPEIVNESTGNNEGDALDEDDDDIEMEQVL